jgi:hypothetical protein
VRRRLVAEAFSAAGDKTVATNSRTMSKGGVNAAVSVNVNFRSCAP